MDDTSYVCTTDGKLLHKRNPAVTGSHMRELICWHCDRIYYVIPPEGATGSEHLRLIHDPSWQVID